MIWEKKKAKTALKQSIWKFTRLNVKRLKVGSFIPKWTPTKTKTNKQKQAAGSSSAQADMGSGMDSLDSSLLGVLIHALLCVQAMHPQVKAMI